MQLQLPLKHQTQPRALHVPTYVTGTIQVLPNPVQFIHTPKRNAMLRQLQRANGCRANTFNHSWLIFFVRMGACRLV